MLQERGQFDSTVNPHTGDTAKQRSADYADQQGLRPLR